MTEQSKPIILIVDDVPKNIQVLGTLLGKIDCELAVAMNGQQALDTIAKVKPDLILLDVMMPVLDGHETCKKLKESDETKDIPVIFLSARTEIEDIVEGFNLGAVDYVTKPFIGSELIARVKTHLALSKANKDLTAEINTRNKFCSIVSHDLRGAFGIITNFVDLIKNNSDLLTPEEQDELLDDISQTSTNTLNLLEDLLSWSRAQTGAIDYRPETLNLGDLFGKIHKTQIHIAKAKKIQLISNNNCQFRIFGDPNMLEVVLRNIVANALKFTPQNGTITIKAEAVENVITVSVSDTGIGIPEDKIAKLFTIDNKTSTQGTNQEQGTGLGLVICKEFIEYHNGTIGIESTPGKGTRVWFTLPTA